jgi:hypothetical protein
LDIKAAGLIFFQVSRVEAEKLKYDRVQKLVKALGKREDKGFASLVLTFDGYNDIPDEIYEIEDIRRWVHGLFLKYPYFLYFINAQAEGYSTILPCISDLKDVIKTEEHYLPDNELLRLGINPFTDLPKVKAVVKMPRSMGIKIITGLEAYGRKIKDPVGAATASTLFTVMTRSGWGEPL